MCGCIFTDTNMDQQYTAVDCIYRQRIENCSEIDKCMQDAANFLSDSYRSLSPSPTPLPPSPSPLPLGPISLSVPNPPSSPVQFYPYALDSKYICNNSIYDVYYDIFPNKYSVAAGGDPLNAITTVHNDCRELCLLDSACTSYAMFKAPTFMTQQPIGHLICTMYSDPCVLQNITDFIYIDEILISFGNTDFTSLSIECEDMFNRTATAYDCANIDIYTKYVPFPFAPPLIYPTPPPPAQPPSPQLPPAPSPQLPPAQPPPAESNYHHPPPGYLGYDLPRPPPPPLSISPPQGPDLDILPAPPSPTQPAEFG